MYISATAVLFLWSTIPAIHAFTRRVGYSSTRIASRISALASTRDQILTEIEQQALLSSTFVDHRRRLQDVSATTTTRNSNTVNSGEPLGTLKNMELFHFSSKFDDIPAADNTNINDKFWRAALKYGTVVAGFADLPENPAFWGPFTVPSCLASAPQSFCVTLTFSSFFAVRYWYEPAPAPAAVSKSKTATTDPLSVQFLEFQWVLFRFVLGGRGWNNYLSKHWCPFVLLEAIFHILLLSPPPPRFRRPYY